MMAHVTAAAVTSEIKTLCHPAAADTIPTSAGREDHVSMSMGAALKTARVAELLTHVIAIEILAACQGFDLLAPLDVDRSPAPDIDHIAALIESGAIEKACGLELE
jgi:histidine ammonia-lyase